MCPRVIRLAGQRRLDQHLGLLEVSPPEPRDGRICLRFDVIGLELQRVVEITSCLLVLSLRNGKISELAQGNKVTVGAPFYNRVAIPVALLLLILTAVGPLLAWRKTSFESIKRNFMWPTLGAVAVMVSDMAKLLP